MKELECNHTILFLNLKFFRSLGAYSTDYMSRTQQRADYLYLISFLFILNIFPEILNICFSHPQTKLPLLPYANDILSVTRDYSDILFVFH